MIEQFSYPYTPPLIVFPFNRCLDWSMQLFMNDYWRDDGTPEFISVLDAILNASTASSTQPVTRSHPFTYIWAVPIQRMTNSSGSWKVFVRWPHTSIVTASYSRCLLPLLA